MLPWSQSGYTGFLQRIRRPLRFLYWSGEPGPLFEACVLPPPKCTGVFSSESAPPSYILRIRVINHCKNIAHNHLFDTGQEDRFYTYLGLTRILASSTA